MELLTILDMAQDLGIASEATKRRLQRKGIVPTKYIGNAGLYKKEDLEAIREKGKRGRPKAVPKSKPAPKTKAKKASKKK